MRYLLLLALAGCASHQAGIEAWRGRSADDLSVAWGSPSAIQRLDDGRRVMNYEHSSFFEGTMYSCRAWFVVDRQGTITETNIAGSRGGCRGLMRSKRAIGKTSL